MNRREALQAGAASLVLPALVSPASAHTAGSPTGSHIRTAIQKVCAWPNLKRLEDGTLVAFLYNQPCHGLWEGDLDCWASEDDGRTWRFRSRPAEHEPTTARMNCAAGFAANGDLVVLCSGWADRAPKGVLSGPHRRVVRAWVCRSSDGGRTWEVSRDFPAPPDSPAGRDNEFVAFGNIRVAEDGSLCAPVYLRRDDLREAYLLRSRDDGWTWGDPVPLNPGGNETDILHLGEDTGWPPRESSRRGATFI